MSNLTQALQDATEYEHFHSYSLCVKASHMADLNLTELKVQPSEESRNNEEQSN